MTERYPDFALEGREWWTNGMEGTWCETPPLAAWKRLPDMHGTITIRLSYPLHTPVSFTVDEPASGWSWVAFCTACADGYERIYREQPENVWGHEIGNLVIEGYATRNRDGSWTPMVGS
jgi:hypothetical protein